MNLFTKWKLVYHCVIERGWSGDNGNDELPEMRTRGTYSEQLSGI